MNFTDKKFGRLTAIFKTTISEKNRPCGRTAWVCSCECGNKVTINANSLYKGLTKSCGCLQKELAAKNYNDLSSQKFGKLTAISLAPLRKNKNNLLAWRCICECGKETTVRSTALKAGAVQSCGCSRYKLAPHIAQMNSAYSSFLHGAKRRNISVEITKEEWMNFVQQPCHYCDVEHSNEYKPKHSYGSSFFCNGIDRLNPKVGYVISNSVPCCKYCNDSKGTMSVEQFLNMVLKIAEKYRRVNG